MRRFFLIFFLLSGCTFNQNENINNFSNISFSNDLSLEEFKTKLEKYAINNPYPNIDN
tara:strand:+ start:54 stop:227 length:174 start_codon:yes stop_codon:yes gene_type:complete